MATPFPVSLVEGCGGCLLWILAVVVIALAGYGVYSLIYVP